MKGFKQMNRKEMLEKRASLIAEARALHNKIEQENREPTAAEKQKFDGLLADAETLKQKVGGLGRLEANENELTQSRGSQVGLTMADCNRSNRQSPGKIQLLAREQRLVDLAPPQGNEKKIDLGELIGHAAGFQMDIPDDRRRIMASYLDSSGSITIPTGIGNEIFDLARNKAVVFQAGAMTYLMRSAKEVLPKLTKDLSGQWKPEAVDAGEDSILFGGIELQARTLFFWLVLSQELWQDAGLLDQTIRQSISEASALEIDRAALVGTGVGEQPRGIYNDAAVTKTAAATSMCYDDLSDSIYRIQNSNHEPNSCVMSPRSRNYLRKLKDGEGQYLNVPSWMPPIYDTKQLPDNLGTLANESIVITGDFTNVVVGIRSQLTLQVLKEIKAKSYQVVLMGALRADIGILRPAAFDVTTGVFSTWKGGA
jgi:HK97 family phage major capsid protein